MYECIVPERTPIHYPDGSVTYEDRETNNFWNNRPKGTVVIRNYMDRTGVHYYDAKGRELK